MTGRGLSRLRVQCLNLSAIAPHTLSLALCNNFLSLSRQVITCEGNAAFYEVGIMDTARKGEFYYCQLSVREMYVYTVVLIMCTLLDTVNIVFLFISNFIFVTAGYSVLGWNHPGFLGSTVSLLIFTLTLTFPHILFSCEKKN